MTGSEGPARVRVQRRVEWAQTDAAGHHHWTSVLHWVEQAQTVLHERLGIADRTFGREPRAHVELTYTARLFFRDLVDVEVAVDRVGTTAAHYTVRVLRGDELAAHGTLRTVHVDPASGAKAPWPDDLRAALSAGGEQVPELLVG